MEDPSELSLEASKARMRKLAEEMLERSSRPTIQILDTTLAESKEEVSQTPAEDEEVNMERRLTARDLLLTICKQLSDQQQAKIKEDLFLRKQLLILQNKVETQETLILAQTKSLELLSQTFEEYKRNHSHQMVHVEANLTDLSGSVKALGKSPVTNVNLETIELSLRNLEAKLFAWESTHFRGLHSAGSSAASQEFVSRDNSDMEAREQKSRECNCKVTGLLEVPDEDPMLVVTAFFRDKLKVVYPQVKEVLRVGKSTSRPLIVKFESKEAKQLIFSRKNLLKGEQIWIDNDLTPSQGEALKVELAKVSTAQKNGCTAFLRHGKAVIFQNRKPADT